MRSLTTDPRRERSERSRNSMILKYFSYKSLFLKDLEGIHPKSLIPKDRKMGGTPRRVCAWRVSAAHPANSMIQKYFSYKSLFLKDLEGIPPKSLIPKDRKMRGQGPQVP